MMMTIYTLESETGNITAFPTAEAAVAGSQTPFDVFTSQQELAELIAKWPADRLLSIYNSLPGVAPLQRLQDPKRAAGKIWQRIAKLGQMVDLEPEAEEAPSTKRKAAGKGARKAPRAHQAPPSGKGNKKAAAKATVKRNKAGKTTAAKATVPVIPRAGSKMAQVIAMLRRQQGASLHEITESMGWQRHTVRGFMAGAMKKAGYSVDSFKSDAGDRCYRLAK